MGNGAEMNMTRLDAAGNNIDMSKTIVFKLEVPANRYDLLCLEGLALAIRYYLGLEKDTRSYKLLKPTKFE